MPAPRTGSSLPIYQKIVSSAWSDDAILDGSLETALGDSLVWAIRPSLSYGLSVEQAANTASRVSLSQRHEEFALRLRRARTSGRATPHALLARAFQEVRKHSHSPPSRVHVSLDDGVLKIWTTENQRVALFGRRPIDNYSTIVAPSYNVNRLSEDSVRAGQVVQAAISQPHVHPLLSMARAASLREQLHRLITVRKPRVVATASTEHAFCRVAVSTCRDLGIPSVYIPHAPTALNRIYADIPHDYAILRGCADAAYYVSLGASQQRLSVGGDQSLESIGSRQRSGNPLVLLATKPNGDPDSLRSALLAIRRAPAYEGVQLLISPHPRGRDRAVALGRILGIEVAPAGWRSSRIIAERNVVLGLVEASSGVALEFLVQGTPVIVLSNGRNYLFEEALGVPAADGPDQVGDALKATIRQRQEYSGYSSQIRQFVALAGADSAKAVKEQLSQPLAPMPSGALDSWKIDS